MTGNIVSRRYAKALFSVGQKQGEADLAAYGKALADLSQILEDSPEALRLFQNPVFSADEKKAVLDKLLEKISAGPVVKNFCNLLADKGRLDCLPEIASDYSGMLDTIQGVVRGKLVTAIKLTDKRQVEIKERLETQLKCKLELEFAMNNDILGGVVLQVGDKVLDASIRAQLQMMKEQIKRGV
ncbi:ATP synthase F1 subunit delta [Maridesulfovibrio frigidus]|uniref:ATP synthase F1 subunit delta n=1 Tax=Maridesulfovibrio frigidus TaxID=340956 RepID=UPI0004E236FD|nr:ATP synthase F1 subunit delta [Maridesulfovibrio frigidus]